MAHLTHCSDDESGLATSPKAAWSVSPANDESGMLTDRAAERSSSATSGLTPVLQSWLSGPVEHVGSTAVVGLASKPVVDMLAPVASFSEAHRAVPIQDAGWSFWPSDPNGSWRLWFLRPRPDARTHHLYLIQHDDPHVRELLVFRDLLRSQAHLRERYEQLKHRLA